MHDRIETAVWTKSEWSPIDTSNDSSFITSFISLKNKLGQFMGTGSEKNYQNISKKGLFPRWIWFLVVEMNVNSLMHGPEIFGSMTFSILIDFS